ncbi:MAG: PIN domain-containing protein [Candidatus Anammoxibacter sp.]
MKDKVFLDTNILIYAIDSSDKEGAKRNTAKSLIKKIIEGENGAISIQVAQEFFQISTKKIKAPISVDDAIEYLKYISIMEVVSPGFEVVVLAARLQQKHRFSFWDAMIIQSALSIGCKKVFTEDLQDGFVIDGLEIINPFKKTKCQSNLKPK